MGGGDGYCYGHGTGRKGGLNRHGQHGDLDGSSASGGGEGLLTDGDSAHNLRGSTGLGLGRENSRLRDRGGSQGHGTGGDTDQDGEGRGGRSQDGRVNGNTELTWSQ